MKDVFDATQIVPFKPIRTADESRFSAFLYWANQPGLAKEQKDYTSRYAIQFVRQINFGPVLSKRYFFSIPLATALLEEPGPESSTEGFVEVPESKVTESNLKKLAVYKNFKGSGIVGGIRKDLFFELNLYEIGPGPQSHKAYAERPANKIDL